MAVAKHAPGKADAGAELPILCCETPAELGRWLSSHHASSHTAKLEYVGAPAFVRQAHPHNLIEAARAAQGRIDVLRAVGGGEGRWRSNVLGSAPSTCGEEIRAGSIS